MTKSELAMSYGISRSTLSKLLNKVYYDKLKEVGYVKSMRILPPIVVRKFWEIYDKPIKNEEKYLD